MGQKIEQLKEIARLVRIDILKMLNKAGSGHTGGSLSAVEILVSLYFHKMRHDPKNPKWPERDIFVLSKGHAAPALYAVLGRAGYFSVELFTTLRKPASTLQGHTESLRTPGVDVTAGPLGQGLSQANGFALGHKLDGKDCRVYVLLGDGELQEGQVWEAAMTTAHYRLHKVRAIVDNNRLQIDGPVEKVKNIEPLAKKWESFGWNAIEVDGHDFCQIIDAFDRADSVADRPTAIIAHTIKGKGVSFMEGKVEFHGVAPTNDQTLLALKELEAIR